MTLRRILNPVYVHAAASGHVRAQVELAGSFLQLAVDNDDPDEANEQFAVAEMLAELGCATGKPLALAVLGNILFHRSVHLELSDPVRSVEYRDGAEEVFDAVEASGDTGALSVVGYSLHHLADEDDRASARLNRIVESLPTGPAQMLREAARGCERIAQPEGQQEL